MTTDTGTISSVMIFHALGFNNLSVSLYSAFKGYATLRVGEAKEAADFNAAQLRALAAYLIECAKEVEVHEQGS